MVVIRPLLLGFWIMTGISIAFVQWIPVAALVSLQSKSGWPSRARSAAVVKTTALRRRYPWVLFISADDILKQRQDKFGPIAKAPTPDLGGLYPKHFDDSLVDDMNQALLALEKRVQDGPGSLSSQEIVDLSTRLNRIVVEMKDNGHRSAVTAGTTMAPAAANSPQPQVIQTTIPGRVAPRAVMDTSEEEDGPAWDGRGGMGQPRGTVNTYVIEGMDEMSPEEYQRALQQSIIDRQRVRRQSTLTGNLSSLNYLSKLSGESNALGRGDSKSPPSSP